MWNDEETQAMAWYDRVLKPLIETEHDGEFVAFDYETGDYAFGTEGYEARLTLWSILGEERSVTTTRVGRPEEDRWIQIVQKDGSPVLGQSEPQPEYTLPVKKRTVRRKPRAEPRSD